MDKERQDSKFYKDTMWRIEHGYLLNQMIIKYKTKTEDEERFSEELKKTIRENVKKRFKVGKKVKRISIYPKDLEIIIKCKTAKQTTNIIEIITTMIDPEEVYMYDPLINGSGYKYYKGEKMIVYQINKYINQKTKKRIENQINKDKIMNLNRMIFNISDVYKIIIITNTKWEYHKEGRPEYIIQNSYKDMLNIFTHQRTSEKSILDRSKRMTEILKEINKRFL